MLVPRKACGHIKIETIASFFAAASSISINLLAPSGESNNITTHPE